MPENWQNKLYFGDNLKILGNREYFPDECVDLIYLDPPFNSNATYNILFEEKGGEKSAAQITAFDDTWHWGLESEKAYHEVITRGPDKLAALLDALRSFLGANDMMAYLTMMAVRLVQLHRVLKPTGFIYLHCDQTANHYLKLLVDAVFGGINFKNDIIWAYQKWGRKLASKYQYQYQNILFYSKTPLAVIKNYPIRPWQSEEEYIKVRKQKVHIDENGRAYVLSDAGEGRRVKRYIEEAMAYGVPVGEVWDDIPPLTSSARERLGYPTQKPEALLERIIKASSNEGDVVLDPFCGCGTAIAVAERLQRRWLGIDITHLAITLIKNRLQDAFGEELSGYAVIGAPEDLAGARSLAREKPDGRYQFEWWALGLVEARPAQEKRKGADTGVDGIINFIDDNSGKAKKIVVQVKSGQVTVSQIRDLKGVVEREKAALGAFLTLREPTAPMLKEAAGAGFYEPEFFPGRQFPRLQIRTIEELLAGQGLSYPRLAPNATFKKAPRQRKGPAPGNQQNQLL